MLGHNYEIKCYNYDISHDYEIKCQNSDNEIKLKL